MHASSQDHITTLALMDPFPLALAGLSSLINSQSKKYEIVFQETSMATVYEKLLYQPVNVLITELYSSNETIAEVRELLLNLRERLPSLQIIIYSHYREGDELRQLLKAPGISLISRNDIPLTEEIISRVMQGQRILSPRMQHYLALKESSELCSLHKLTRSEYDVIAFLFNGKSLQEIANIKHRSIKTISTHKCSAMRKLQVRNDSELFSLGTKLAHALPLRERHNGGSSAHQG